MIVSLKSLERSLKIFLSVYIAIITIGVTTGLVFLKHTTSFSPSGAIERFNGNIDEEDLLYADGVINFSISNNTCEIIVDDGERRIAPLVKIISNGGVNIKNLTLGQTDLEDVFIEFAKGIDTDMGVCN